MNTITTVELPQVRRILKAAGLTPAKRDVSKVVRGYSTVSRQGFALANETKYTLKQHVRTGKVLVDLSLSSWNPNEEAAANDIETARKALAEAGLTVRDGEREYQLVVSS